MIAFDKLEHDAKSMAQRFCSATPYPHLVVDGFCHDAPLRELYARLPDPVEEGISKSRDYVFAKNKYEKSGFKDVAPPFAELYRDLTDERFKNWLQRVTGEPVFVDPDFHGGGIHQGGPGSFLDMHADFNTHPAHHDWFRNLNILLYLNPEWKPEHKGQLKLRHKTAPETTKLIEPLFNRCVIMFTRDYTLHGYDAIDFPPGAYRRSIAAYAYSPLAGAAEQPHRSTTWYPDSAGVAKTTLGRLWPTLVSIKGKLFGSATSKNR